jgi:hypothetical protein
MADPGSIVALTGGLIRALRRAARYFVSSEGSGKAEPLQWMEGTRGSCQIEWKAACQHSTPSNQVNPTFKKPEWLATHNYSTLRLPQRS